MGRHLGITKRQFLPALAAGVVLACLPAHTAAQDSDDTGPLDSLKACQSETDPGVRLACYDSAVGAMVVAEESGQLRVVDAEEVRRTRRGLFGFSIPDLGLFGRGDRDAGGEEQDAFDTLETTVSSVRYRTPRSFVFRVADGNALWEIDDAPRRLLTVETGDAVTIQKAALGSYFVRFKNQGGVKGRRVE